VNLIELRCGHEAVCLQKSIPSVPMEASEAKAPDKDHIGKLPGDGGWFRLASTRSILPWSIGLFVLLLLAAPVVLFLPGLDVPTRVRLGVGGLYVAALFGVATACDRAVQLERIARRK